MNAKSKSTVKQVLALGDMTALMQWTNSVRTPLRLLFSITYDDDPLVRYQALDAIGKVASMMVEDEEEKIRSFIRGLFWLMSEESGGIGWQAPEAIAEICVNIPSLSEEYSRLLPQFLKEESFRSSALAALYRLAPIHPGLIEDCVGELKSAKGDKKTFQVYSFSKGKLIEKGVGKIFGRASASNNRAEQEKENL